MKKLSVTPITNSAQFFPKKGTLEFLQLAHREGFTAILRALIGAAYDPAVVYILYGVENTGTYPVYTISEGVVFFNGEIYYVDAAGYSATGSDVAVFSIIQTQYTTDADPVTLSDATVHNIHNIFKMQTTAGAPGSGLANFTQAFRMNFNIPPQFNLTAPTAGAYAGNQLKLIGAYPDTIAFVPPATNLNPVLYAGSYNVGDYSPGTSYAVTFPSALATASYYVMGCICSNGTPADDVTLVWGIRNRLTTGFTLNLGEFSSSVQNVAFEYIIFAK